MQINIHQGSHAVAIYANDETGPFHARVWVNCEGKTLGDATLVARKFKSLKGAKKWAAKQLAQ